jgi:hypothetical protein
MNRGLIIIDAFLESESRLELFKPVLEKVKKLDLPILLISNSSVPKEIQNEVDYFIYDKRNILFEDSYDSYPFCNFWFKDQNFTYEHHVFSKQKHGLSVLCNLTKCCNFAIDQGYNKFIRVEWDFLINNKDFDNIYNLIHNFIKSDKKGYFIFNPSNGEGLKDLPYHFWMVDLDFWNKKFPKIYNEKDYQKFILQKNGHKKFEIAERVSYLAFEDSLNELELINETEFLTKIVGNSAVNFVTSDVNFLPPSSSGVCRGFAKVFRNGSATGELVLISWNRISKPTDYVDYSVIFNNSVQNFKHETPYMCWNLSGIKDFDFSKFPITLKMNNGFEKIYQSASEINSLFILN